MERRQYEEPEEKTIRGTSRTIGKPFVVLVNSKKPYGEEAKRISNEIEEKYSVKAMPVNCEQLKEEDIFILWKQYFWSSQIRDSVFVPKWVEMLPKMIDQGKYPHQSGQEDNGTIFRDQRCGERNDEYRKLLHRQREGRIS